MYISDLRLWNFRKYGSATFDLATPHLSVQFNKGLNVLVGENDSGKSAIVDAIKVILGTHSFDHSKLNDDDFHKASERLRIELKISGLSNGEAKFFAEWLGFNKGKPESSFLLLNLDARRRLDRILPYEVRAGADKDGAPLNAEAREYLRVTYLKPLRDANAELVSRKNSRLSQILLGHEAFRGQEEKHYLIEQFAAFNSKVRSYFTTESKNAEYDKLGKALKDEIDRYISAFTGGEKQSELDAAKGSLRGILEKLELSIHTDTNPGLGTLNRLFMATELVHLNKKDWPGLRVGLVEELEAHLHPQAQMQIIEAFRVENGLQVVLTTHSPNLASKVRLDELILCSTSNVFPMGAPHTKLAPEDYQFLEWFLDVTKANLFFARGVILVEGWAEEILLPAIADAMKASGLIKKGLTESGVSIVNVGSTAFLRYAKIFGRKNAPEVMKVPVSVITDVDVAEYSRETDGTKTKGGKTVWIYKQEDQAQVRKHSIDKIENIRQEFDDGYVKSFVAPRWTLEYSLLQSPLFSDMFQSVFKEVHPGIDENDCEKELAVKLLNKGLDKTDLAHRLAQLIRGRTAKGQFALDLNECSTKYLLEAIRHATGA